MTDPADFSQPFLYVAEIWAQSGDHGLHQQDAMIPGDGDHFGDLTGIGSERFLAHHMLSHAHAEDGQVMVRMVRSADVDRI